MKLLFSLVLIFITLDTNCKTTFSVRSTAQSAHLQGKGMPNKQDVLLLIMENCTMQLPLNDPNCGSDLGNLKERTLGKFLAKYWERQMIYNDNHQNYITVEVIEGAHPSIHEKHWWIYFEIWGRIGDAEPWSGGVRFHILDKDWKIVQETLECYAG